MSSRSIHAALLALGLFAGLGADDASAYCRMTTEGGAQVGDVPCIEKGAALEWKGDACLSYAIDYRGSFWMDSSEIDAAVDAAFNAWQTADCGGGDTPNLIFKPLQASTCQRAEFNTTGNVNTIAFLDPFKDPCADEDAPGYDPRAFAVTVVWHNTDTGQILDADMMINDGLSDSFSAGGPYATCPDTGCAPGNGGVPGDADLRSIVTHEAGHFIGIGHSDVEEATMFARATRTSVENRTLEQDDRDAVCEIYPPGNLDSSCNAAPMGGLALNCETDSSGNPLTCDDPAGAPSSGGGCSASGAPDEAPWAMLLAALLGLTVMRRRSSRRVARS